MSKAIYAFSGDPPTFGHLDIIKRVSSSFDHVVVGIGVNPNKIYMFSLEKRKEMTIKMVKDIPNVSVVSFDGLLIDYVYEQEINTIIRGIRNSADLEYEQIIHEVNMAATLGENNKPHIETFCLFADPKLSHVSSSVVKALQQESGFIQDYVPLHVKQELEKVMLNRYMLGMTGSIGAGKSYACKLIKNWCDERNIPCTYIDLDIVAKDILNTLTEPAYVTLRNNIAQVFPGEVLQNDGFVNRQVLGDLVFENPYYLELLNTLMAKPVLVRLSNTLRKSTGLVLLESALFAEGNITYLCNNNILYVDVNKEVQSKRLVDRNYGNDQVDRRVNSQYSLDKKIETIEEKILQEGHGFLLKFETCPDGHLMDIGKIIEKIGYETES